MKSGLRLRNLTRPVHFAEFGIKSRGSQGNIVTKHPVDKILIAPKDFTP
jgi:topoisomerase-4 subunit A